MGLGLSGLGSRDEGHLEKTLQGILRYPGMYVA